MIVSIDPGARDGGHFAFQIGGKSVVSGFGTLAVTPSGSLTLAFDGPATLQPTLDFGAPSATPAFSSRPVTISLRATIAGDYRSADATLAIGADRHMLTVRLPDPRGVPDVLSAIEAAFLNDDPRALYPLLNVDLRSANTVDQFETQWRTQSLGDGRRIVGLTRGEIGAVELLSIGWAVVRVAYRLDTRRTTGSSTTASEMVLIHERSGWKLWMTSER